MADVSGELSHLGRNEDSRTSADKGWSRSYAQRTSTDLLGGLSPARAMNLAHDARYSGMELHGLAGEIHVTERTWVLVRETHRL